MISSGRWAKDDGWRRSTGKEKAFIFFRTITRSSIYIYMYICTTVASQWLNLWVYTYNFNMYILLTYWQLLCSTQCRFDNLSVWQYVSLTICQFDNMPVWQYASLTICQFDNMPVRQYVSWTTWFLTMPMYVCMYVCMLFDNFDLVLRMSASNHSTLGKYIGSLQ
jgi:hypothetical protein